MTPRPTSLDGFPRVSGDEPAEGLSWRPPLPFSPRERDEPVRKGLNALAFLFSPRERG